MSSEEELSSSSAVPMSMDTALMEAGGVNPSSNTGTNNSSSLVPSTVQSFTAHNLRSNSSSSSAQTSSASSQLHLSSSATGVSSAGAGVKVKRTRQRVDAGEPRNSYASIANFSSTRSGYQLIRSGRNPVGPLFGPTGHLNNQSHFLNNNSNSNEGFNNSFNGNSPPNFKLLQQLSGGNISPKSSANQSGINNDSNNNLGQFKSNNNNFSNLQDKERNMILIDEAVMQMAAAAAAMNNPGLNGNSMVRNTNTNQGSNHSDEELSDSDAASHLLRDILQQGGVGSVRGKQQLEQVMAGLAASASKDGQGTIHGIGQGGIRVGGTGLKNQSSSHNSQCSDEDEERDDLDGEENEGENDDDDHDDDELSQSESSSSHFQQAASVPTNRRKTRAASKQLATEAEEGGGSSSSIVNGPESSIKRKLRSSSKNNNSSSVRRSSSQVSSGSRSPSPSSDHHQSQNQQHNGSEEEERRVVEGEEEINGNDEEVDANGKSCTIEGTTITSNGSEQEGKKQERSIEESQKLGGSESESAPSPKEVKLGSKLEKLVSNMSQVSSNNIQINDNGPDGQSAPVVTVPVNGCKKRKLYQPVQSSKLTTEEDEDEDELLLSNDEDELDDCMEEDIDNISNSSNNFLPSSPKRSKQQLTKGQQYLELLKSHVMNRSQNSGSEDERDIATSSPLSDRSSTPLNFNEIKQQALDKVTAAILNQRCGSSMNGNGDQWVTVLKSELVENVAKAIEITFADFNRRNPMIKRTLGLPIGHRHREELIQVTNQQSQPKDISLLTQMLESKPTPPHHHHHHHQQQQRARGATLLGKAPSVRDDRSSKNSIRGRPPMNGHPHNVNPFDRDGHLKGPFPSPFPGFPSPMSGFKNPFPFFPHGGPNPAAGLPPMPATLAQHFTSIANALQRQREEVLSAQQQSSVANLSRAMDQRGGQDQRDNESPRTNNSSSGNVDTQSEALSLVVSPKRKVGRPSKQETLMNMFARGGNSSPPSAFIGANTPSAPPPPLVPVSLASAIPNSSLHGSTEGPFGAGPAFPFGADPSRFSGLFAGHRVQSPEEAREQAEMLGHLRDKPGLAQVMSNAALASLAGHHLKMLAVNNQQGIGGNRGSPDSIGNGFSTRDGMYTKMMTTPGSDNGADGSEVSLNDSSLYDSGNLSLTSTLTPMHLRKAKLMFFYVRYPSSAILKMFFPDIKFNKNNTAQLVKWFSNFREFYYIQMEKYARQAVSEGVTNSDDIRVGPESEILRVLNLHYNRNNHIDVPSHFRFVVEQTLKEFFKSVQQGKDSEQSWKKAIYKIIARLDDSVPEYFKSPTFLDQLE